MSSWLSHGWPCAVPDLHEAHAALEQPAGDQQSAGPATPGPYMSRMCLRLAADVEGVGGLGLHAVGQLERLDARFELRVVLRAARRCCCVELLAAGRAAARCCGVARGDRCGCSRSACSMSVCCVSMYVP